MNQSGNSNRETNPNPKRQGAMDLETSGSPRLIKSSQHRYVYPRNKYFNNKIPTGEKLDLYLNDSEKNCSPDRKIINGSREWNEWVRPYLSKMCDILPPSKVKGVFGPYMYAEFHGNLQNTSGIQGVEKTITLFGEYHILSSKTAGYKNIGYKKIERLDFTDVIPFHSYMKSLLLSNQDKIYDLYLETPFIDTENSKRKLGYYNFTLSLLEQQFENCLQLDKSRCEYKNIRIHYTDIRQFDRVVYGLEHFNSTVESKLKDKTMTEQEALWIEFHRIFWQGIILGNRILASQLVNNDQIDFIKTFIIKRLEKITTKYYYYASGGFMPVCFMSDAFKSAQEQLILDIYILGRLTKNKNLFVQKNIIIYTGGMHTRLYIKFLKFIGFTLGKHYNIDKGNPYDVSPPIVYFDREYDDELTQNKFY